MDKDNLFRAIMAAMIALLLWSMISKAFFPQPTPPPAQPPKTADTTGPPTTQPKVPQGMSVQGAEEEEFIDLGNVKDVATNPYPAHVRLSRLGASLVFVRLTHHAKKVDKEERYELLKPVELEGQPALYSLTTDQINLNGSEHNLPLGQLYWHSKLEEAEEGQKAVYWVDLLKEEKTFARLTKTFLLSKSTSKFGHADLKITLKFENLSEAPLQLIVTQRGPVGVPQEDPRSDYRRVTAAADDGTQIAVTSQVNNTSLKPGQVEPLFNRAQAGSDLSWLAVANKFLGVIVTPEDNSGNNAWVMDIKAISLTPQEGEKKDSTFALITLPLLIQPGQSISKSFDCYLGPKSKALFIENPTYAKRSYVRLVEKDYYWCAFGPIVDAMLWLLNSCHDYIPPYNYGVAIIFLVLIVRLLLHPLTKKGQVNMTKMSQQMSVLQPKMEEIRKKYANDKTKLNQETMKLYQQEGINPAGQMLTCLPMMFQMPIWGGLWAALNFTVEMRHQPFCLWIRDLTAPDALFSFDPISLPLMGQVDSFNILPPLLGVGMWLQQRLMPKPASATRQATKTKDQMAQQRMIMTFMSVFMIFIFYNAPSGLTLYIMASNFFGLFEQYRIRKHLREEEEKGPGAAGAGAKKGPKKPGDGGRVFKKPKFLEKLEKMAEEAKKK